MVEYTCVWCGEKFKDRIDLLNHNVKDTQCHKKASDWPRSPLSHTAADLSPASIEEARRVINSWSLR